MKTLSWVNIIIGVVITALGVFIASEGLAWAALIDGFIGGANLFIGAWRLYEMRAVNQI